MSTKRRFGVLLLGLLPALLEGPAHAADRRDGPRVQGDPSTDINDLYAWMSPDGKKVYLAMTVFPEATSAARFSSTAYYVFHTASRPSVLSPAGAVPLDIVCSFDQAQRIQCWVGTDKANYVSGDASNPAGLSSKNGKFRVFAGLRGDPFFFNLEGFQRFRNLVRTNAGTLTIDANGCPNLSQALADTLVSSLRSNAMGNQPPTDAFRTLNTLALVLEVDRELLSKGGSILSVWAATRRKS
ncbi:MAG: DUF4331 family protein [Myxococcales bacterium]|nr:DUF4331 domain-containing protein [Myxococcota bacterium]MDW8282772.1 DUF4331 family protein [Myxococcales bacterium]